MTTQWRVDEHHNFFSLSSFLCPSLIFPSKAYHVLLSCSLLYIVFLSISVYNFWHEKKKTCILLCTAVVCMCALLFQEDHNKKNYVTMKAIKNIYKLRSKYFCVQIIVPLSETKKVHTKDYKRYARLSCQFFQDMEIPLFPLIINIVQWSVTLVTVKCRWWWWLSPKKYFTRLPRWMF